MSKVRNYDIDLLTFWVASPGFILGEGILGQNVLGGDLTPLEIDKDFISFTHNQPVTTDGINVYREVETFTLNSRITRPTTHYGKRLIVMYDDIPQFIGTVREYEINEFWTDAVNTPEMRDNPGNINVKPYKDYSVFIKATSGEDNFARTPAPAKNFNGEDMWERMSSYLGLTSFTDTPAAGDINAGLVDNLENAVTGHLIYASDDEPSLLDAIRNDMRLKNYHYRYQPWDSNLDMRSNSRWVGKDAEDESTALALTPDPDDLVITGGDSFVHNGNVVGYTERTLGRDRTLFVKGVTITMTNNLEVTTTYGPYRASGAFPEDIDINIGRQSDAGQALADKIAATLPLRSNDEQFVKRLKTKLQSRQQLGANGAGPGMAVLKSDVFHLADRRIAILGVTHTVTRDLWEVEYECGPEHLISRESDSHPFIVLDFNVVQSSPTQLHFTWTTPSLNTTTPLYAIIYSSGPDFVGPGEIYRGAAKAEGASESIFISPFSSAFYEFTVYYTNNPTPNSTSAGFIYSPAASDTILI